MDNRVDHVIQLMKADPKGAVVPLLAEDVNLSESRLNQIFKQATGHTPRKYLKHLKLEMASALLKTTFLTVKQIAAEVGWRDITHFQRDFKRVFGVSPREYKRTSGRIAPSASIADGKTAALDVISELEFDTRDSNTATYPN